MNAAPGSRVQAHRSVARGLEIVYRPLFLVGMMMFVPAAFLAWGQTDAARGLNAALQAAVPDVMPFHPDGSPSGLGSIAQSDTRIVIGRAQPGGRATWDLPAAPTRRESALMVQRAYDALSAQVKVAVESSKSADRSQGWAWLLGMVGIGLIVASLGVYDRRPGDYDQLRRRLEALERGTATSVEPGASATQPRGTGRPETPEEIEAVLDEMTTRPAALNSVEPPEPSQSTQDSSAPAVLNQPVALLVQEMSGKTWTFVAVPGTNTVVKMSDGIEVAVYGYHGPDERPDDS